MTGMKLHDVGLSGQAQPERSQQHAPGRAHAARRRFPLIIGPAMGVRPLDSVDVIDPHLLDAMHGTAPLAKQEVVERRNREELFVTARIGTLTR
jgi:hypothetical protein